MASLPPAFLALLLLLAAALVSATTPAPSGAVYAMTNDISENALLAYTRNPNGTLSFLASFPTRGKGAILDAGEGVDPLISAYSVLPTANRRFLLVTNAGSASVTVFRVFSDFSLRLVSVNPVPAFGPVSIAIHRNLVYVASADEDGEFSGGGDQKGALAGYVLTRSGSLLPLSKSARSLPARPGAVQFSPDGGTLVVTHFNAGSAGLNTTAVDEVVTFKVFPSGRLSPAPVDSVSSAPLDPPGRNLPTAIGFQIVRTRREQFVVVPEARAIPREGFPEMLQTSTLSTWRLTKENKLDPVQINVLVGQSLEMGQMSTCWISFSKTQSHFWVTNTETGTLSAFSFSNGKSTLVEEVAGRAPFGVDQFTSPDGQFLYQLYNGHIGVFRIARRGLGPGLTKIQTVDGLPELNVQGIVAI